MKNNHSKKFNLYTQGQPWAVRALLIVGLVSVSLEGPLAKGQGIIGLAKQAFVGGLLFGSASSNVYPVRCFEEPDSSKTCLYPESGLRDLKVSNDREEGAAASSDNAKSFFETVQLNRLLSAVNDAIEPLCSAFPQESFVPEYVKNLWQGFTDPNNIQQHWDLNTELLRSQTVEEIDRKVFEAIIICLPIWLGKMVDFNNDTFLDLSIGYNNEDNTGRGSVTIKIE